MGHGPPAKVIKKARKLLGRRATAGKKTGQSADDGRDMDIPAAALLGARKGLVYCLVGLISHRRYSSKVPHLCHAFLPLSLPGRCLTLLHCPCLIPRLLQSMWHGCWCIFR